MATGKRERGHERAAIEGRRARVAAFILDGGTRADAAAAEDVGVATIGRDWAAVRRRWRAERDDVDALMDAEWGRLMRIDEQAAAAYAETGAARWLDVRLRCIAARARLFGLDVPAMKERPHEPVHVTVDFLGKDGRTLSHDDWLAEREAERDDADGRAEKIRE